MSTFYYKARDNQGLLVTGELEVNTEHELISYFSDHGLIPLAVKKTTQGFNLNFLKSLFQQRIKEEEILVLTRQFFTLFKAGMSMESVIGTLIRQTSNKRLKDVLQRIRAKVASGEGLSKSFAGYSDVFGDLYTSMLAAGEEAGILEEVLENLAGLLEKEIQIKTSVRSATLYPKIVIFVLIAATIVIMTFVVPQFASFFSHYKADLPLPTRILMGTSNFFKNFWYVVILVGSGSVLLYKKYAKTGRGQLNLGRLRFRLPVFGLLNIKIANSRFCHILGALYRSGLPITRCLEITGKTIENGAFMREVDLLKDEVTKGKTISEGMETCQYFTPVIIDATAVGEKTGSLDEILESMGEHYDVEVQHTIKNLTTLLEPFLLFFIFGMVAVFALAIFLPIWNISRVVTHH